MEIFAFVLLVVLVLFLIVRALVEQIRDEKRIREGDLREETIKNSLQDIAEYLRQISSDIANR